MRPQGSSDLFRRFHSVSQSNSEVSEALNTSRGLVQEEQKVIPSTALQDVHTDSYKCMDDMVEIFQKQIEFMTPIQRRHFEQAKETVENQTPMYTVNHVPTQRLTIIDDFLGRSVRDRGYINDYFTSYFGDLHHAYLEELFASAAQGQTLLYGRSGRVYVDDEPRSAFEYRGAWEEPESVFKRKLDEDYRAYLLGRISFETYERRQTMRRIEEQGGVSNKKASFVLESEY